MANILVVAAHPDDEVLGCGGTIARHAAEGDRVRVVIVSEGLTSRGPATGGALDALHTSARKASEILGVSELYLEGLPDNRLDSLDRLTIIKKIEHHVAVCKPAIVYTHHAGDVNIDHQVVHHSVVTVCRPRIDDTLETVLYFEVPSSTEWQTPGSGAPFQPNWFIDISSYQDAKLRALEAYGEELRIWPHPRSIEAVTHLGKWRGCTMGTDTAEAFMLGRHTHRNNIKTTETSV